MGISRRHWACPGTLSFQGSLAYPAATWYGRRSFLAGLGHALRRCLPQRAGVSQEWQIERGITPSHFTLTSLLTYLSARSPTNGSFTYFPLIAPTMPTIHATTATTLSNTNAKMAGPTRDGIPFTMILMSKIDNTLTPRKKSRDCSAGKGT